MALGFVATVTYGPVPLQADTFVASSSFIGPVAVTVREAVENKFGRDSIMVKVAFCESTWRQYGGDGEVLKGIENPGDYGVFQIHAPLWQDLAQSKGWDIETISGNLNMAEYLYETYGLSPWAPSADCRENKAMPE